jgi:cell division transport system ATP-binding protein
MIELQDVSVAFGQERTALSHITLRIKKGELVFIVGSTGSGKSTFLKLLYRELIASSGKVVINHQNLAELRRRDVPHFRRRMGVVFQDFGLLPNKTVFENVAFALRVIGAGRREIRKKVPVVLDLVGLTARCDAFPNQISGGEQQRVAIARALVNDPPLLIADEPTGNLDPDTSLGIYQILAEVNQRGTTVVVATHDHAMVDAAGKRVVEFDRGRLVRDEERGLYSEAVASSQ